MGSAGGREELPEVAEEDDEVVQEEWDLGKSTSDWGVFIIIDLRIDGSESLFPSTVVLFDSLTCAPLLP